MGVNSASNIVYNIKNLSIKCIKNIIDSLRVNDTESINIFGTYRIDVDFKWLEFKLGSNKRINNASIL